MVYKMPEYDNNKQHDNDRKQKHASFRSLKKQTKLLMPVNNRRKNKMNAPEYTGKKHAIEL